VKKQVNQPINDLFRLIETKAELKPAVAPSQRLWAQW
jgi:hypothetical protein